MTPVYLFNKQLWMKWWEKALDNQNQTKLRSESGSDTLLRSLTASPTPVVSDVQLGSYVRREAIRYDPTILDKFQRAILEEETIRLAEVARRERATEELAAVRFLPGKRVKYQYSQISPAIYGIIAHPSTYIVPPEVVGNDVVKKLWAFWDVGGREVPTWADRSKCVPVYGVKGGI